MLGSNYPEDLQRVMQGLAWDIQLPPSLSNFFQETGASTSIVGDERRSARLLCRTRCIVIPERSLPTFPRLAIPVAAYLSDISRHGAGFVSTQQYFPEEIVRILLPTFWIRTKVTRGRYLGPKCFQTGVALLSRYDPSPEAFRVTMAEIEPALA